MLKSSKKKILLISLIIICCIGYFIVFERNVSYNKVLKELSTTKKIIINKIDSKSTPTKFSYYKTITSKNDIKTLIEILSNASLYEGWINLPEETYHLEFMNKNDKLNSEVHINYFIDAPLNIKGRGYNYYLKTKELASLEKIIES